MVGMPSILEVPPPMDFVEPSLAVLSPPDFVEPN
jgi:hypothetical protein